MKKPASCLLLALISANLLMLAPNTACGYVSFSTARGSFTRSDSPPAAPNVILHQDFDNETTGTTPGNWNVTDASSGSLTVDETVYHGDHGKSAKFVDNSTKGSPGAYTNFTEQTGTIAVSFAVRFFNTTGNNTGLELRVDNGTSSGANIIFANGTIQYRDQYGQLVTLRSSYVANRWYNIKFIMNIHDNVYNIHIDDHLEAMNTKFTGPCDQIHRILINETLTFGGTLLPMGYIDDVEVRKGIVIPTDFPTIQGGIDEAAPGDIVVVSQNRTYFESVTITKNLWLIGQEINSTVIDGRFGNAAPNRITVSSSNVTIYGFTITHSAAGGAQIHLEGSGNTITNNIIQSGLGDAIHIIGSNNTVTSNTIQSNLKCGIIIEGSNSTITGNTVYSNLDTGIRLVGSNSTITSNNISLSGNIGVDINGSNTTVADNVILSNGQLGIHIAGGKNSLVLNNTIQDNIVGLSCETGADEGKIFQNRFVGNGQQALDRGTGNKWDDGYPYNPENETGGGNYWSSLVCADAYSGPNQNENVNCSLPSPDGICDQPYNVTLNSTDRYPLFLIQNVTQNPTTDRTDCNLRVANGEIDYNTNVTVTTTVLKYIQVTNARIYVEYNGTKHDAVPMSMSGNSLTGTITNRSYGTTVRYNVSALAYEANWLNSTNYPIPFPYFVRDWTPPNIDGINIDPNNPDENQTITAYAAVTEPPGASGVAKVLVSYQEENTTWWTAEMTEFSDNNYTAAFPKQPGNTKLNFTVTAFDKAGNNATKNYPPAAVNRIAELSVAYANKTDEPCSIDLGVVSGDQKIDRIFTVKNLGDETLSWKIDTTKGGAWLKSVNPINGSVPGGASTPVTMTVDTNNCPDPSLYVVELSVKANGKVPQWAVIETFTVRYIVIDQSWASSETPNRSDVGVTQYYAFHAKWANNCSDATGGTMALEGMVQGLAVNDTGWGNFNYSTEVPTSKTFTVAKVQFGSITAVRSRAPDRTTIWDRVSITLSLALDWIDVDSTANVSWNGSYYESDKSSFDGRPLLNQPPIHDAIGRYPINASSIIDDKYRLTAFESNTVWCIWDEINIIGGGVSSSQLDRGQTGTVWFIVIYRYENKLFKGSNGTLYMNDNEPLIWSSDREAWAKDYNPVTTGTIIFSIARVEDRVHNLTRIDNDVGPLSITWGSKPWWSGWWPTSWNAPAENQPFPVQDQPASTQAQSSQTQDPVPPHLWPILAIILVVGIGMIATILLLIKSEKKRSQRRKRE
jgi:parallel beta-helix repeat protein